MLALHTTASLSTLPTFPDFVLLSNQTGLHFGVANRLVFHISACKLKQHHINLIIHDSLTSNPCEAYVLIRAPRSVRRDTETWIDPFVITCGDGQGYNHCPPGSSIRRRIIFRLLAAQENSAIRQSLAQSY